MPPHSTGQVPALGYSYVRFSSTEQARGDSLRRQTAGDAEDWCLRNGVKLDTSVTLRDLGTSAFTGEHRKNPDRHALAAFLKLVKDGRVPKGSYLIVENLDRLTREDERAALRLWMDLLDSGINIVQLSPEVVYRHEKSDMLDIMRAIMELSRGHSESKIKSERVGKAWAEKKRKAREGVVMTHSLPAWVEERGGKLRLIPGRAAVVKRIFGLAAGGYGRKITATLLNKEKVPSFGPSGSWAGSYIGGILADRRALGEFQPRTKRGRMPDGDPIPGYYPAAVSEAEWLAARAGAAQRKKMPGRTGAGYVNVFAGLLKDARDGRSYFATTRYTKGYVQRSLINTAGIEGRATCRTFPFDTFERAVLSLLREVDPHEILNGDDGPDETLTLAGELAGVEARAAELESELLKGDVAALARVLRQLEDRKRDLAAKLSAAREKAAHPLSETWGEAQSLLAALDAAPDPDDARLRLRSALRRVVDSVWLLVLPRGRDRLCAAQVWFAGGERHRDYLIWHRPATSNGKGPRREGGWWARSLADAAALGPLDLRDRGQARQLEAALAATALEPPGSTKV